MRPLKPTGRIVDFKDRMDFELLEWLELKPSGPVTVLNALLKIYVMFNVHLMKASSHEMQNHITSYHFYIH